MIFDPDKLLRPFLESVEEVRRFALKAVQNAPKEGPGELLRFLLDEIQPLKTRLEQEGPAYILRAGKQMEDNKLRVAELTQRKDALLEKISQTETLIEETLAKSKIVIEKNAQIPPRPIPVPTAKLPEPAKPLELSEGGVLRELLLPTAAQPVAQAPKVAGNIWENWRKVGYAPAEDYELGQDEDLEG
jgi:hypothetical protein